MLIEDRQNFTSWTNSATSSRNIQATRRSVFADRPIKYTSGDMVENRAHLQDMTLEVPAISACHCPTSLCSRQSLSILSPRICHVHDKLQNTTIAYSKEEHLRGLNINFDRVPVVKSTTVGPLHEHAVDKRYNDIVMTEPTLTRSLTSPSTAYNMTSVSEFPGSPPDLTDSQTSPSNSNSDSDKSRPSSPRNLRIKNMNFEDISLNEGCQGSLDTPTHLGKIRYTSRENALPGRQSGTKRPALAALQTQPSRHLRAMENGVQSATAPSVKQNFASTTTLVQPAETLLRVKSVSPSRTTSVVQGRSATFAVASASSLTGATRRYSWLPVRKTAKQLEAEYHDSDDDLPDDASLFNVPISPFPTYGWSAKSSPRGSPSRSSKSRSVSPGPIPLGHARTAPESPPFRRVDTQVMPKRRGMQRINTSNPSTSLSPNLGAYRDSRAKSWTQSMADLDHEARIIADKLDHHANTDLKALYRSSAPSAIPLPPIQRGTLDFLPASKEKQAILSRTRPSWLPPKDPKEEAKHLKQYKHMMQAAQQAERKREEQIQQHLRRGSEGTRDSLHKIWTFYVDPTTDLGIIDRRLDDLCWRGIPPQLRGRVWKRAISNPACVSGEDYAQALTNVRLIKAKLKEEADQCEQELLDRYADIERDAETVFPELKLFDRNGPLWQDLIDVCEAYVTFQLQHQYFFGVLLLAALLLLQFPDASDAFAMLANCLHKLSAIPFHLGDGEMLQKTYRKTQSTLQIKHPRLHDYLFTPEDQNGLGFAAEDLLEPMFFSLFSNGLDAEQLCRIWDVWFFKGDRILPHTAVAVLGALQSQIFDVQGDATNRRSKILEMLSWGPYNRLESGYYNLALLGEIDAFVGAVQSAGEAN